MHEKIKKIQVEKISPYIYILAYHVAKNCNKLTFAVFCLPVSF